MQIQSLFKTRSIVFGHNERTGYKAFISVFDVHMLPANHPYSIPPSSRKRLGPENTSPISAGSGLVNADIDSVDPNISPEPEIVAET